MSCEPITFSNINYGTAINVGTGAFTASMLVAALGFAPGNTNEIGTAVDIGALAAPDYRESNNPGGWLWKPDTVQTYMTAAAAQTVRNAVNAAYAAGNGRR